MINNPEKPQFRLVSRKLIYYSFFGKDELDAHTSTVLKKQLDFDFDDNFKNNLRQIQMKVLQVEVSKNENDRLSNKVLATLGISVIEQINDQIFAGRINIKATFSTALEDLESIRSLLNDDGPTVIYPALSYLSLIKGTISEVAFSFPFFENMPEQE